MRQRHFSSNKIKSKNDRPSVEEERPFASIITTASLAELNLIFCNLRLGKAHLQKNLSSSQMKELLLAGKSKKIDRRLYADFEEKSGRVINIWIPIATSCFGVWMGVTDFLYQGERSILQLILIAVVVSLLGAILGLLSVRSSANSGREALANQRIMTLQKRILTKMTAKMRLKNTKMHRQFTQLLQRLGFENDAMTLVKNFYSDAPTFSLSEQIYARINNKLINKWEKVGLTSTLPSYVCKILYELRLTLWRESKLAECYNQTTVCNKNNFSMVLTQAINTPPKPSLTFSSWLMSNFQSILIRVFPLILGTCGSSFMFLTAIPDVMHKLGIKGPILFLSQPFVKVVILLLVGIFILYLSASQCKAIYKSWLRSKALEKTSIIVNEKELEYYRLKQRTASIKKVYCYLVNIIEYLNLAATRPEIKGNPSFFE